MTRFENRGIFERTLIQSNSVTMSGAPVGGVAGHEARSRGRLGQRQMAINYRTRFAYRIDMWDAEGENIIEHLAGVEDLQFAKATYLAACKRWPRAPITLSEGMHVIEDNRRKRLV
jgi:hypothetical protein